MQYNPITVGSLVVAALSLLITFANFSTSRSREARDKSALDQKISDKLDRIDETSSETKDTVKVLTRELRELRDDYGTRITKLETELLSHGSRLDRIEAIVDANQMQSA